MMKLLIIWYTDGDIHTRKFSRKQVIENDKSDEGYLIAWMTEGKFWKHYVLRRVTQDKWEQEFRKPPVEPTAT